MPTDTAMTTFLETWLDSFSGMTSENDGSSSLFRTYLPVSNFEVVRPQSGQGEVGDSVALPHQPQMGPSFRTP